MKSSDKRRYLQFLFALAWVDDELGEKEETFLERLVSATHLSEEDAAVILPWFDGAPPDPDWDELKGDFTLREELVRQALVLASVDQSVNLKEMALLDDLRRRVELDDDAYGRIVRDVEALLSGAPRS